MDKQDLLDALAVVGFIISVANYGENLDQTTFQQTLRDAVDEVHDHLQAQDKKLDLIMEMLR